MVNLCVDLSISQRHLPRACAKQLRGTKGQEQKVHGGPVEERLLSSCVLVRLGAASQHCESQFGGSLTMVLQDD